MQDVYFHLPGIFEHFEFYLIFLAAYHGDRDKFYEWAKIGSIFGAPREAFWNGGRLKDFKSPYEEEVIALVQTYDIPCRFTFTNPHIDEQLCFDGFGNMLLAKFDWPGHKNQVIVNSEALERHIRTYYPSYKLISSTTKCIVNEDETKNEINKDYIMTVIDYNYNKDFEFLKSIENKDKVELLINPVCDPKCPRRKEHYDVIGRVVLHQAPNVTFECNNQGRLFYEAQLNPVFISLEDIQNVYAPLGFKNFKIEGRTTSTKDLLEILLYYMVKPEYQLEIRQKIQHSEIVKEKIK